MALSSVAVASNPGSGWVDVAASLIGGAEPSTELSGVSENAAGFGDQATATCRVFLAHAAFTNVPDRLPIRITFSLDGVPTRVFQGVVLNASWSLANGWSLDCGGAAAAVVTTRAYSPAFERRPIATKTTATSVEDPSAAGYAAGPLNWLFWQAGGRPLEQDYNAAYVAAAVFWYRCDQAILAPDWSWLAGDNGWDDAAKKVEACGGQLFQGADGVVRYRQPLAFGNGTATYTFSESVYATLEEQAPTGTLATAVACPYVTRAKRPMQEVVRDTTPRLVAAGATLTIPLEPQWPLASLRYSVAPYLNEDCLQITFLNGAPVAMAAANYNHFVTFAAQQVVLTINNVSGQPFVINQITLQGEPITSGEAASITVGSGSLTRTLSQNPEIQSAAHAQQLAQLYLDFYQTARPVRTLGGCAYDPDRFVGETVNLSCARRGLSAAPHVITAIRVAKDLTASYDLASVAGLPKTGDYYVISSAPQSGPKKIGY